MQHDRGCICQQCTGSSTTDSVLVGILVISGVVIAISTGSIWLVAATIALLVGLALRRLRAQASKDRSGAPNEMG